MSPGAAGPILSRHATGACVAAVGLIVVTSYGAGQGVWKLTFNSGSLHTSVACHWSNGGGVPGVRRPHARRRQASSSSSAARTPTPGDSTSRT